LIFSEVAAEAEQKCVVIKIKIILFDIDGTLIVAGGSMFLSSGHRPLL
jgi:hypothetical protein